MKTKEEVIKMREELLQAISEIEGDVRYQYLVDDFKASVNTLDCVLCNEKTFK